MRDSELVSLVSWLVGGVCGILLTAACVSLGPRLAVWLRDSFYEIFGNLLLTSKKSTNEHGLFGIKHQSSLDRNDIRSLNRELAVSVSDRVENS